MCRISLPAFVLHYLFVCALLLVPHERNCFSLFPLLQRHDRVSFFFFFLVATPLPRHYRRCEGLAGRGDLHFFEQHPSTRPAQRQDHQESGAVDFPPRSMSCSPSLPYYARRPLLMDIFASGLDGTPSLPISASRPLKSYDQIDFFLPLPVSSAIP